MSDLADILGVGIDGKKKETKKSTKKKEINAHYSSLPRDLRDIIDESNPPPLLEQEKPKKIVLRGGPAQKWIWDRFKSSARNDNAEFHHWVRRNVEYPDYPFARFNIPVHIVTYTEDEYNAMSYHDDMDGYDTMENWTKEETDLLFGYCKKYDLRWPVIANAMQKHGNYSLEWCQQRFFAVTRAVLEYRQYNGLKLSNEDLMYKTFQYDPQAVYRRRSQADTLFSITGQVNSLEIAVTKEIGDLNKTLASIGATDAKDNYGPVLDLDTTKSLIQNGLPRPLVRRETTLQSRCSSGLVNVTSARYSKGVQNMLTRVLEELGVGSLNQQLSTDGINSSLAKLKHDIIVLLLVKKFLGENAK